MPETKPNEGQTVTLPDTTKPQRVKIPDHVQTPAGQSDGTAADVGPSRGAAREAVEEARENVGMDDGGKKE